MPNPSVPIELKRRRGNPGKRDLPERANVFDLEAEPVSPLRPLGVDGRRLWDDVFGQGEIWVSGRTDSQLLQLVCEQIDRRALLLAALTDNPTDRSIHMSLNDVEKLISGNLSLLGFTPSDRSRLGVAEVRAYSKIDDLRAKRDELLRNSSST
jgi:hypothetical protein